MAQTSKRQTAAEKDAELAALRAQIAALTTAAPVKVDDVTTRDLGSVMVSGGSRPGPRKRFVPADYAAAGNDRAQGLITTGLTAGGAGALRFVFRTFWLLSATGAAEMTATAAAAAWDAAKDDRGGLILSCANRLVAQFGRIPSGMFIDAGTTLYGGEPTRQRRGDATLSSL